MQVLSVSYFITTIELQVPGSEGKAGMAAIQTETSIDLGTKQAFFWFPDLKLSLCMKVQLGIFQGKGGPQCFFSFFSIFRKIIKFSLLFPVFTISRCFFTPLKKLQDCDQSKMYEHWSYFGGRQFDRQMSHAKFLSDRQIIHTTKVRPLSFGNSIHSKVTYAFLACKKQWRTNQNEILLEKTIIIVHIFRLRFQEYRIVNRALPFLMQGY